MAQYTITRSCGHEDTVQIYGTDTHGQRDRQAARLATQPCGDCRRSARDQHAADLAAGQNLPALTGSDKQVAWAGTIRAEAVNRLDAYRLEMGRHVAAHPESRDDMDLIAAALTEVVASHTAARWWIDNRSDASGAVQDEAYEIAEERRG